MLLLQNFNYFPKRAAHSQPLVGLTSIRDKLISWNCMSSRPFSHICKQPHQSNLLLFGTIKTMARCVHLWLSCAESDKFIANYFADLYLGSQHCSYKRWEQEPGANVDGPFICGGMHCMLSGFMVSVSVWEWVAVTLWWRGTACPGVHCQTGRIGPPSPTRGKWAKEALLYWDVFPVVACSAWVDPCPFSNEAIRGFNVCMLDWLPQVFHTRLWQAPALFSLQFHAMVDLGSKNLWIHAFTCKCMGINGQLLVI